MDRKFEWTKPIERIPGTYTVTVTETASGCTSSTSFVVNISTNLIASITGNLSICAGSNATLSGTGGTTYTWSDGFVGNPNIVSVAGTYTVSVSDGVLRIYEQC
ncbi:MAG: hypothetical protein IPO14_04645 [Saprospiraceae bacterium]|nr:hypothetical protein [Saprospiraceae bacterium]